MLFSSKNFCFFQNKEGIRSAQESRGVGKVYKKQPNDRGGGDQGVPGRAADPPLLPGAPAQQRPVPYTHLTLPTNREV